jgi:hypothetical protein
VECNRPRSTNRRWLASALATPENGSHLDLGRYAKQDFSHSRGGGACERCGLPVGLPHEGDDPCLSDLPGVVYACCGHGWAFGYATLSNGVCLMGRALKVYLAKVGRLKRFQSLAGERGWIKRSEDQIEARAVGRIKPQLRGRLKKNRSPDVPLTRALPTSTSAKMKCYLAAPLQLGALTTRGHRW